MLCRTLADIEAAARAEAAGETPLTQEAADRIAAILLAAQSAQAA